MYTTLSKKNKNPSKKEVDNSWKHTAEARRHPLYTNPNNDPDKRVDPEYHTRTHFNFYCLEKLAGKHVNGNEFGDIYISLLKNFIKLPSVERLKYYQLSEVDYSLYCGIAERIGCQTYCHDMKECLIIPRDENKTERDRLEDNRRKREGRFKKKITNNQAIIQKSLIKKARDDFIRSKRRK
jgi:hypothetical protein